MRFRGIEVEFQQFLSELRSVKYDIFYL